MRTFIALELPQEIKDSLAALENQLKATQADVKWVAPQNIHLTLKFLGEIDEKKLDKITHILEDITKDKVSFLASITSLGGFPKLNFPRVIWVGIEKGDPEIKEIVKELEEKLAKIGIPREKRPFSSHITIGRVRSPLNREKLVSAINNLADNFRKNIQEFKVTKITLFKSTLTPKGPVYEVLKEANLKSS